MLAKNICLALLGFSAGITAAGGLFSFIIGLGVISDFADRTHTGEQVMLYEDAVAAGGSLGAVISVYHPAVPFAGCLLPVMGLFGLPGEAFAVLISAFFAKASGCATAASMYEAGALTLGQASMMLPACILMGTLIGHYARIVLVTDTNKKWHPLLIALCLLDAAISLVIMRVILAAMGVQ